MPDLGWIIVRNWNDYQARADLRDWHYIRLHCSLLSDDDFLGLPLGASSAWPRLLLAYASSRGQLRADTSSLSRRLGQRITKETLELLVQAGFIVISAAKPQRIRGETAAPARASARERQEQNRKESPSMNGTNPITGWWHHTGMHVPENQQAEYMAKDLGITTEQASHHLEQLRQEATA